MTEEANNLVTLQSKGQQGLKTRLYEEGKFQPGAILLTTTNFAKGDTGGARTFPELLKRQIQDGKTFLEKEQRIRNISRKTRANT